MGSGAYYNEFDPIAAEWLRWLISKNLIAAGEVDSRSITEVQPDDLIGFTQAHFFAGIGGWSYAARLAGWPDDRPLWTGSCPCQPFSAAGKGGGIDDPRHLWPDFHRLIRARRPPVVMGEQVAGKAGYGWLDGVLADLANERYAGRGVDFPSCAVDAPHIRNRIYWVAESMADAIGERRGEASAAHGRARWTDDHVSDKWVSTESLADPEGQRRGRDESIGRPEGRAADGRPDARRHNLVDATGERWGEGRPEPEVRSGRATASRADAPDFDLGNAISAGLEGHGGNGDDRTRWTDSARSVASTEGRNVADTLRNGDRTRAGNNDRAQEAVERDDWSSSGASVRMFVDDAGRCPNGTFWSDAEWIQCHDGKARRAQSGSPLLAHGVPGRVAAWRGFGNAINVEAAKEVIAAYMETSK
jgi:DNA (cytosine-5)-methyltransferase 1